MYEFWCDYVKPKYEEKANLYYMNTEGFIVYIKKKTFMQTLQKMFSQDLIIQIKNKTDHYTKEKIKK